MFSACSIKKKKTYKNADFANLMAFSATEYDQNDIHCTYIYIYI